MHVDTLSAALHSLRSCSGADCVLMHAQYRQLGSSGLKVRHAPRNGDPDHAECITLHLRLHRDTPLQPANTEAERPQVSVLSFGAGTFGRQSSKAEVTELLSVSKFSCEATGHWHSAV